MTGAGAPGGPGILKALLKEDSLGLVIADADPLASGSFLHQPFYKIPKANDPSFVDSIWQICRKERINVVFPLVTKELFELSKCKGDFSKENIKIVVSDSGSLEIANNKSRLYEHLKKSGILTPEFIVASTTKELYKAIYKLGYPDQPICIKPSVSNGSRGVRIVTEKINEYDLLFNYKPNNLYISLQNLKNILRDREIPEMLVSEYLPDEEYTIDTIVNQGKAELIVPRIRTKMNGGISVQGQFIQHEEICRYCERIIGSMDLHGPIGIQVKKGRDGIFKVLEINPRIQGTSVAALGAGVNLPLLAVKQEYEDINFKEINVKWGTGFSRYYEEVFY